jgi:hypothetical protein
MRAMVLNANIRGHEEKNNKKGEPYILVRYEEDGTGKPCDLVDKDMNRAKYYLRDKIMNLTLDIDAGKQFTTIRIIDAKEV